MGVGGDGDDGDVSVSFFLGRPRFLLIGASSCGAVSVVDGNSDEGGGGGGEGGFFGLKLRRRKSSDCCDCGC